jgi:hypothetical protein
VVNVRNGQAAQGLADELDVLPLNVTDHHNLGLGLRQGVVDG